MIYWYLKNLLQVTRTASIHSETRQMILPSCVESSRRQAQFLLDVESVMTVITRRAISVVETSACPSRWLGHICSVTEHCIVAITVAWIGPSKGNVSVYDIWSRCRLQQQLSEMVCIKMSSWIHPCNARNQRGTYFSIALENGLSSPNSLSISSFTKDITEMLLLQNRHFVFFSC